MSFLTLYPLIVTAVFLGCHWLIYRKIRSSKKERLREMKDRDVQDPIETEAPGPNSQRLNRQRGLESIETRFRFLRQSLPLFMFLLWAIVLVTPFLNRIPAIYVSLLVAILSVVAAVSLKPFLENIISGLAVAFFQPVCLGDTVLLDGEFGLVEDIGLTHTTIKIWDWKRVIIPNSKLFVKEFQNLTLTDSYIWAYVEFYVEPGADLQKVESIARKAAQNSKHRISNEEPAFWVMDLKKDTIQCWIAAWAQNPSEAWELRHDIRIHIYSDLQAQGIGFHQMDVHVRPPLAS